MMLFHRMEKFFLTLRKPFRGFYQGRALYSSSSITKNILPALPNGIDKLAHYSFCNNTFFINTASCQIRKFQLTHSLYEDAIVVVPPFPESVAEGGLKWEKKVGDTVSTDEVVAEVETDKTAIPVPSPGNGVIVEVYAEEGASVKAGQKLFKLQYGPGGPSAKVPKVAPSPQAPLPAASSKPAVKPVAAPAAVKPPPAARPSPPTSKPPPPPPKGPQSIQGAVVKLPSQEPSKEISGTRSEFRVKMTRIRARIAQRLKEAQNTNAMLTTFNEIDMSGIMEFRKLHQEAFSKKYGIKLGFMSAFLKASSYALQDQPIVNAVIEGTDIVYRDYVDISVAVATPKGLVVPVVRNVHSMNFADIEKAINALGEKARKGRLAIEDMDGGTFTISNGGVFGSLMGTPIINPPQSAILGMHATFDRPVAIKGQVVIRPMMYVALTYDHRLIDGREAVLFLKKIKAAVEDPRIIVAGL